MENVTQPKKTRKTDRPRVFTCTFTFGDDIYLVSPLRDVHPNVARKAYRLKKQTGELEVYDVKLTPEGHVECDCKGHQRWGHCKHSEMLAALGCLPEQPSAAKGVDW